MPNRPIRLHSAKRGSINGLLLILLSRANNKSKTLSFNYSRKIMLKQLRSFEYFCKRSFIEILIKLQNKHNLFNGVRLVHWFKFPFLT